MLTRMRWLASDFSAAAIRALAEGARRDEYDDGRGSGFRISNVRKNSVSGIFVERFELTDTYEDPFGRTLSFPRVEFRCVPFSARTSAPGLELVNYPRSVSTFLSRLGELLDFEQAMSPVRIDVLHWLSEVESRVGRLSVVRVGLSGLVLSSAVAARVDIDGTVDVRRQVRELVGGRQHTIDYVLARTGQSADSPGVKLSCTGSAQLSCAAEDRFAADVREALGSCL